MSGVLNSGERRQVEFPVFELPGQMSSQVFTQIAALFEFAGVGNQLDAQAFDRHPQLEAAQAVLDQPHAFSAPSV